jgi:hypothetical protein
VSIQNVINATRIMMDPDVAEVVAFRDGYVSFLLLVVF